MIRRSATISLFSPDDEELITCKSPIPFAHSFDPEKFGKYWKVTGKHKGHTTECYLDADQYKDYCKTHCVPFFCLEGQRGQANNSVMLLRETTQKDYFYKLMESVEASRSGEPGVYWTNDLEMLTNPCVEISLPSMGFCNLTEVNVSEIESWEDIVQRVEDASFLGTLQAGYTDFHYLRQKWRENAENDALLGVSFTGTSSNQIFNHDIKALAEISKLENARVASIIGIKPAKRIGCTKPSGTASLVLGTSSGIHAWHNDFYERRIRVKKKEPVYQYIFDTLGYPFIEDDESDPENGAVLVFPVRAPKGASLRTESPLDLLARVYRIQSDWIRASHREGVNYHNVSVTVSVAPDQWKLITDWMWDNRNMYNGISLLDYDGGVYVQPPFTDITEERYEKMKELLFERYQSTSFNLDNVIEVENIVNHQAELACSGGQCEIV